MTTVELKHSILQDINGLMDDEVAMHRLSRYVRRLRKAMPSKNIVHEELTPYTMSELHERINKSEESISAGNVIDSEVEDAELADFLRTL